MAACPLILQVTRLLCISEHCYGWQSIHLYCIQQATCLEWKQNNLLGMAFRESVSLTKWLLPSCGLACLQRFKRA